MKAICLLVFFSLTAPSLPFKKEHIQGENGWFIPQMNGPMTWMDSNEAESKMNEFKMLENTHGLFSNPVNYYLNTAMNPTEEQEIETSVDSITNSNFNSSNPTIFIIHGWNQNYKANEINDICAAWLTKGDFNIIRIDWSRGRSIDYISSVAAVSTAGEKVGGFIDFLVTFFNISLNNLQVIGHSLGAHVAGYAGKNLTTGQIHTIVGLDPASPLFSYDSPTDRLAMTDATYVESIQTCGGLLGFLEPIGKATFYPNGGKSQPGCGLDLVGACAHSRSLIYYAEAILKDDFLTIRCSNYQEANAKDCGMEYSSVRMSALRNEMVADGVFYVPINNDSPYGIGN